VSIITTHACVIRPFGYVALPGISWICTYGTLFVTVENVGVRLTKVGVLNR
jgi:hypothetical protein